MNLGNDEPWDTHERVFHNLREFLFPPTDRAVSASERDPRGDESAFVAKSRVK